MDTPALAHLVSAYFHQDWMHEFADEWASVDAFVTGAPDLAPGLPDDVARVLIEHPSESAVEEYLDALGCEYTADPATGGYRAWLTEIARRVTAATSRPTP